MMLPILVEFLAKVGLLLLAITGSVPLVLWLERKGAAWMQDRTGPDSAAILGIGLAGMAHSVADMVKLAFKADLAPQGRHRIFHALAPMLAIAAAMSAHAVVPFGDFLEIGGRRIALVVADLEVGVLHVLALWTLGVHAGILGGWAGGSGQTFLGALRSAASAASYLITMGLALMGLFMIFGSLRITELVAAQGELLWGWLPRWGVVVQPVGFLLLFGAVLAGLDRAPLDMADGARGFVAGCQADYGGFRYAAVVMAANVRLVLAAALIASLFFGGYQIPWLPRSALETRAGLYLTAGLLAGGGLAIRIATHYFRRSSRMRGWRRGHRQREPRVLGSLALAVGLGLWSCLLLEPWMVTPAGASVFATLAMSVSFIAKTVFCAWLLIWVRWTALSLRYDQVVRLAWRVLLPLGLINLAVTSVLLALSSR